MELTEYFGNVGIVHVGASLEDLSALVFGPNHECVHRSLDVLTALTFTSALTDYFGTKHLGRGCYNLDNQYRYKLHTKYIPPPAPALPEGDEAFSRPPPFGWGCC